MTVSGTGGGLRHRWRPGRDRATGYAAVGLVGVLIALAALLGAGAGSKVAGLADVGGWLGDSTDGTVVHVNGLTGGVDGWVHLDSSGHPMKISQGPGGPLVVDQTTGEISRIDPAQVTVAQAQNFGQAGLEVFDGGRQTFLVNAAAGDVWLIDPATLSVKGPPLVLAAPLGHPGLDASGTLWVPLGDGTVAPVTASGGAPVAGAPVKIGAPGDPLALTVAAGAPVVTDARSGSVTVLSASGGKLSVSLPPDTVRTADGRVTAPDTADTPVVPVLAEGTGTLLLVDTEHGSLSAVRVDAGTDRLEAPQTLGGKVYIPDDTTGSLIVYDTASGVFQTQITVTGHSGHLQAQVRDGLLWVDDQAGEKALVIGPDGTPRPVDKAAPGGPAATTSAAPTAGPSTQSSKSTDQHSTSQEPTQNDPGQSDPPAPATSEPRHSATKGTPSSPSSPPAPTSSSAPPPVPGAPTAKSGPGYITVTFPPAAQGAAPTGYILQGAPAGATVSPTRVPANGPYSFRVTGGTCAATYSFTVVAQYNGTTKASPPSVAVRPCTVPAAPAGFAGTAVEHGANLRWNAVDGSGGTPTYRVTGPGTIHVAGTTATVGKLTDSTTAAFRLTASTPAGTSNPAATTSVPITGPKYTATAWNDSAGGFNVRDAPNTKHAPIGSFPKDSRAKIVVLCQEPNGEYIKDATVWSGVSYVWDKVQYQGGTGWVAGIYVSTPQVRAGHYTVPDSPKIWPCR